MKKNLWIIILMLAACSQTRQEQGGILVDELSYATTFHFETRGSTNFLVIDEPWPGATEKKSYELGTKPKKVVCTSTSYLPYFELLGEEAVVVGFPNTDLISSEVFQSKVEEGTLVDLGPDGGMNFELLMSLDPDVVIAFDMGGESQALNKIQRSGIPVIYNSDFLEKTPLGRAEWIKFFGALLNKRFEADSIFAVIERRYLAYKALGGEVSSRPTILSGVVYGDTWFMPGGQNWASIFFENAGGTYLWDQDTTSGWLELSFEAVYEKANSADFWIGTSTLNNKKELLGQESRYGDFAPFKNDQVFSYNKRIGPKGGYDFFESGYSRPDLVLADLIKILHPELVPDHETHYFQKLE